jgi:DNA-binding MarR family transcriptional regulator
MPDQQKIEEYLSRLEPGVRGYVDALPGTDAESVRTNLAFVRAAEVLGAGPRKSGESKLPTPQFSLLRVLFFTDGNRMTQIGIGRQMGVTSTYITRLVDELETRGLVKRLVNLADRRQTFVQLTETGKSVLEESLPGTIRFMEKMFRNFSSDEKKLLQHLLTRLTLGIEEARVERSAKDRKSLHHSRGKVSKVGAPAVH